VKKKHRTYYFHGLSSCIVIVLLIAAFFLLRPQPQAIPAVLSLSIIPDQIYQGDPCMIQVNGVKNISDIVSVTFGAATTSVFDYVGKPTVLVGIDLHKKPDTYSLRVTLRDGRVLDQTITVLSRARVIQSLGIPARLGGNTSTSSDAMIATLNSENETLAHIYTATTTLWSQAFTPPLEKLIVTNPYGYVRQTGTYQIPHKGVDYRAAIGTPVMAINSGVVRLVATYRDYGNVIVIDHGLGLMSFYLHLSKMDVQQGDTVQRGQVIGESGQTGYAEGPHLHLSVRIDGVSIDPVKFLALFK
jgi:murein DD-endopeptidase MepM/ murein hydrolase activator NlpD